MASVNGIPLSKVSPAFLHANSTSHTWAFSAFAELIDNAYDPDVSASELLIDKVDIRGVPCLIFLDNGAGMDTDHLLKMLSFGFCEKDIYEQQGSHQPIGHYGNGFKSGSMRIGQDSLVFTRCHNSASIGFLSQTYLKSMNVDSVMVPILEYRLPHYRIKSQESRNNLNAILEYSVFKSEYELREELKALAGSKTGTKVIIYNLKTLQDNTYELDFASDPTDIRCPEAHEADMTSVYHRPIQINASEYKRSLREYCSILFLRPRMKITIRGVRVRSRLISKSLSTTEIDIYKPTWLSRPVKIIFGFNCDTQRSEDSDYGMMLYHRNRLIKAFEKVGYQKQPNGLGVGVVGIAQVDFLQPIHNKQDFNKDEKFNSVMAAFANKLNDYWNEKKGSNEISQEQPVSSNRPDWLWAQCEHCLKWRRLPDVVDRNSLPQQWFCRMNPDGTHNRCDIPEEPEDEDLAVKPTYEKTYKKKQEERKRLQQMEREKEEDTKRRKIMAKEEELKQKEATLRAIQQVAAAQPVGHFQETRAMMSLQKALAEARKREDQQKRLILQIQEQKKLMEEERNSLLQMAESLQAANASNNKVALKQMSQLISPSHQDSLLASTVSSSKRRSNTENLPIRNTRARKRTSIKAEPENALSVADDDDDANAGDDDNFDTDDAPLFTTPSYQSNRSTDNGFKENIPAVKAEAADKASSAISSPRQLRSRTLKQSSSETPSMDSGNQPHLANVSSAAVASHVDSPAAQTAKARRKSPRKGRVVAVIDLTCESEFGELIDVKPSPEELRATLQNILQYEMVDKKPDKDALDAFLAREAGQVGEQEAGSALKEEILETATQGMPLSTEGPDPAVDYDAVSDVKDGDTNTVSFQNSNDDTDFTSGILDSFQNNLEAAIAAIQERMEQDMSEQESGNLNSGCNIDETVVKDENGEESSQENCQSDRMVERGLKDGPSRMVERGLKDGPSSSMSSSENEITKNAENRINERRNSEVENKENAGTSATQASRHSIGDFYEIDSVSDDSVDDRSDYRDYSKVDEKGETDEQHVGRKSCSLISKGSRGKGFKHADQSLTGVEGDSSVSQESAIELFESCNIQRRISGGLIDLASDELNFTDIPNDGIEVGLLGARGQDLIGLDGVENLKQRRVKKGELKRKSNLINSDDTFAESSSPNLDALSKKSKKSSVKLMGNETLEDNKESHTSRSSKQKNEVVVVKNLFSVRNKPERGQSSDPIDFSVTSDNDCNEDDALEEFDGGSGSKCYSPPRNHSQSSGDSDLPPINTFLSCGKVKRQRLKRTSDQYIQTDPDMAAVNIFQDNVISFGQKDSVDKKEPQLLHGQMDKSFQTTDFNNSVETEVQTEDFVQNDLETFVDLQTKLTLKSQLLENMEARLAETYVNVHKLLRLIVPEAELGDVNNIDQVIKDMVAVSEMSGQLQSQGSSEDS